MFLSRNVKFLLVGSFEFKIKFKLFNIMVKCKLRFFSLIMFSYILICLCIFKIIDICKEVLLEKLDVV